MKRRIRLTLALGTLGALGLVSGWIVGAPASATAPEVHQTIAMAERPDEDSTPAPRTHPVSPYVQSMIDAQGGTEVIVLVPRSMTPDEPTAKRYALKLKVTPRNYTAVLRDGETDIVVVGTSTVHPSTDDDTQPNAATYVKPYEEFDDGRGGTISFGYANFDYAVEFYCRDMTAPGVRPTCIDAEKARDFIGELLP